MVILLPTGQCFSDACEYIEMLAKTNQSLIGYKVVHAICKAHSQPSLGWFAHGWVERGDTVIFAAVVGDGPVKGDRVWVTAEKTTFYKDLKVQHPRRYSLEEVADWNIKTGNLGPWEEPYTNHTRTAKERRRKTRSGVHEKGRNTD
jgi:hypothetical protein